MVDKIRKLGFWLWFNKERIFLVIMVGILCYRVYQVLVPSEKDPERVIRTPSRDVSNLPQELVPPIPPPPPPIDVAGNYAVLHRQNPFWYHAGRRGSSGDRRRGGDAPEIALLNIQKGGDSYRAQLRTSVTSKWYQEGESFQEFELLEIDPDGETVVINDKRTNRRYTLRRSGR